MLVDTHCHLPLLELDDPVVVELPLRGEWSVERTSAYRIPSHGTDLLGQRYAYDLVRTDHRSGFPLHPAGTLRLLLFGGRMRNCYGWGPPRGWSPADAESSSRSDVGRSQSWLAIPLAIRSL
jgi:hypothetical protein